MKRKANEYLVLALKGAAMGAADVVPGVSGGTIALITGVYEELLESIKSVNFKTLKLFFTGKFKEFWRAVNGDFLVSLLAGILISILSLAKLITVLLRDHPIYVWAFFFGLVVASTYFVAKRVGRWNVWKVLAFIVGAVIAYLITIATPAQTSESLPFIFLCGMIAICAMILPGISGSFILVLLGKYEYIMRALTTADFPVLIVFAIGCLIGIVLFSHVLTYLLKRFHDFTIALLSGFMLGSLNKVWPWKELVPDINAADPTLFERNIAPNEHVLGGILRMVLGFAVVYILEVVSAKK